MSEMACKGKKGKKSSPQKQVFYGILGPEYIPQQLRDWRVQRNASLSGYGVSKSWRSVSKQCNSNNGSMPQLQLSCADHNKIQVEEHGKSQLHNRFLKVQFLPEGFYTSTCKELRIYPVPFPYESGDQKYIPPVVMVSTGLSRPALLIWRPPPLHQPPAQVEYLDCTLIDPYDSEKQSIIFTNAIGFKGKFYALSLHGALTLIEDVDSSFTVTGFGKNRAIPSLPSRRFIEYLIESNGEILLVFLISRKSISMIDYVEIVKLDLVTLSWVKMESLGDRALFLPGANCRSFIVNQVENEINQVGYRRNHVYFTHQGITYWKEFDMERRIISRCCNF